MPLVIDTDLIVYVWIAYTWYVSMSIMLMSKNLLNQTVIIKVDAINEDNSRYYALQSLMKQSWANVWMQTITSNN